MRSRIVLCLLLAGSAPAAAHVTLTQPNAAAGRYYVATFRVGHGCSGSPTTALRIAIPESIARARPQPKPGWTLQIAHAPLREPVRGEGGKTVTSRVSTITWTGGPLPSDQFDEFRIMMKLPSTTGTLLFPVTQICAAGVEHWSQTPEAGGHVAHPAPALTLTPAAPAAPAP